MSPVTDDEIKSLSTHELKAYLSERNVDFSTCTEKDELIDLALHAPRDVPQGQEDQHEDNAGDESAQDTEQKPEQEEIKKKVDYYAVLGVCSN